MNESINHNDISVCQTGEEKYVYFNLMPRLRRKSRYCQYDYRTPSGEFMERKSLWKAKDSLYLVIS